MEIYIQASCFSEKADVSIGFGISLDAADGSLPEIATDWISEGMSESFWENYQEFEDGIAEAERLQSNDNTLDYQQALYAVFGHFHLRFEVNGEPADLNVKYDADEAMYMLLAEL